MQHLVARFPVEAVREDVHAFGRAAGQRDLVGGRADELRDLLTHLVDLLGAPAVGRVLHDFAHVALVGVEHHARHRPERAVVHVGQPVNDVELTADLPPVRVVELSSRLERIERERRREALPAERAGVRFASPAAKPPTAAVMVPPMNPRRDNPE